MKKLLRERKRIRALTAVTWLLMLAVLLVWAAGMYCVTSVTAESAVSEYEDIFHDFASTVTDYHIRSGLNPTLDLKYENYDARCMWETVEWGGKSGAYSASHAVIEGNSGFVARLPRTVPTYSATAVFDGTGELLECSWKDFFYFEYLTEDQWKQREERSLNNVRAFFDREKLTEAGKELLKDGDLWAAAMRYTGRCDGEAFTATKIEYIDRDTFRDALYSKGSGEYTVSGIVEDYQLPWLSLYEDPEALPQDAETVVFYTDWFDLCYQVASPGFQFKGKEYDNAAALVAELGPALAAGRQGNYPRYEGKALIYPSVAYCYSVNGETYFTPYYQGENTFADKVTMHFYTVSVVYCSPWKTAVGELRNVYLYTFLLALALFWAIHSRIKGKLLTPLAEVSDAIASGSKTFYPEWRQRERPSVWQEPYALTEYFLETQDSLQMRKNEITRLQTALDYARTAEENRRQMTSNIAHELKTPLAVVHSYAEGLKERIAEEKRDRYLDVILSETERMDGMVLEMLELSRLEAGKVKLARDQVSLGALARAVFEKLELAVQAKGLRVEYLEYGHPKNCTVTADESRIGQVIENFASNAVKYTPAGGQIWVKLQKSWSKVTFSIENESAPLSAEALDKVWDSFYRTDEARSGGGTGLGLAIAKSIIDLHGGKCFVQNTKRGVEFGFVI